MPDAPPVTTATLLSKYSSSLLPLLHFILAHNPRSIDMPNMTNSNCTYPMRHARPKISIVIIILIFYHLCRIPASFGKRLLLLYSFFRL